MTKKRNLTTFMIAIMIILFSLPANAQGKVGYAKWDELNTTLTFYGGESVPDGAFELNTGEEFPGWGCDPHCSKVVFDESFKDVRPTSCFRWFGGSWGLTTIEGIENLNTEEVTNMSGMFYDCQSLTSLDLSSFNTAKVTNMDDMFISCSSLTSLDLSSFNTAKVENMSDMFWGCSGLTSLDLSSFNTAEVTDMSNMFEDCSALTTIYVSDDFTTDNVSSSDYMFYNCSKLNNGNVSYSENNIGIEMAKCETGYFTKSNLTPYVKWNGDTKVLTFKVANYTTGTNGEYKLNEGNNEPGWLGLNFNCTKVVFTPSFKQAKPTSCYKWFSGFGLLTTIQGIENLNTEEVTNMSYMFDCCQGLTSLDLSSFNTANVKNMSYMFQLCPKLSSLDLSSFNTTKVSDMYAMFFGCSGLTSLDLSSFNTEEVTNMGYMFGSCSGLTSLDLSSFNTAKVTNMTNMFNYSENLTTIYVSDDFTTGKVCSSGMFEGCKQLVGATSYDSNNTGIDMANYNTGYFKTYFTLGENKVELCGNPLTTKSLNLTGDYDFTPKYEFKANEATYSRDLLTSESTWFSLCLPFAYTPNNFNFTAYQLKGATANAVEIEEITETIAAGTPVLFKFKDSENKEINISATDAQIVKAPVDGTAVNGPDGYLQLCGTYQEKTFAKDADDNAFILLNNKLMNPAKIWENKNVTKVSVKPFRAYMTSTAGSLESSARAFSIGFGEDEEGTTAIDQLNTIATDDAEYYDINGSRISGPVKGLNIVRHGNKTMKLIIK